MTPRILYLHQHYSSPAGSMPTRSHGFAQALAAQGHSVTIACGRYAGAATGLTGPFRRGRREGLSRGLRVVEFDIPCGNAMGLAARSGAFLRYAAQATRLALAERWDLVIASSTPLTVVLPALAARRLRGTPFLFEIRDPWPELPRALGGVPRPVLAAMERLARAACRRAAATVALSDGMAETALARGADPARLHVVPNGCDLELFGPHIAPWRPAQAASDECLALYAGAHGRANGLHTLLDAAALLRQRGERRLRIVLVGDGSEKPALMARAAAEGLANVTFLDPHPRTAIGALHAGCQIALHLLADIPAFAEWTAPNKLMDGLAAGRPVITNQPGRAARLVLDGPSGIAVPPGDAAALAAALMRLAALPAMRAAMGEAGRRQAVARWDRRLLAERFCAVVNGMVGDAPRLPARNWRGLAPPSHPSKGRKAFANLDLAPGATDRRMPEPALGPEARRIGEARPQCPAPTECGPGAPSPWRGGSEGQSPSDRDRSRSMRMVPVAEDGAAEGARP